MKGNEELRKKILHLMLPMAFQQFLLALVSASDTFMLGSLSQASMSAASLATQVTFVFNLFLAAFTIGENMFVAQYFGKKDYDGIAKAFALVLRLSCAVGLLFLIGTAFFAETIMGFFTDEQELITIGSDYLRIAGFSYLLSAAAQVCMTLMKNCGAVNLSTVISSVTVALNILLNAVLIFGLFGAPALGIRGAAIATVAATAVQTVWSTLYVALKMGQIPLRLLAREKVLTKRFWEKTGPVLFNELAWGGGVTMYSVILGHLGADAVAANGLANTSKNLIVCLCLGLGSAGSIAVGNELGAGHFQEAKKAGHMLVKAAILCGVFSGLALLLLSPAIWRLTDLTPAAKGYLKSMLLISSYYLVGKSVNCMTVGGIFPAGGDSRFGMLCDTITLWCITIPLGSLCAFLWKLPVPAVYFVLNLDEIIKLPAVFRHYRKYGWVKNIT